MGERQMPPRTKFSEVDSYLHSYIRDLEERVNELQKERMGYSFVYAPSHSSVFCQGSTHVFLDGSGRCTCGMCPA